MRFRKNKMYYSQDCYQRRGIPAGVDFHVSRVSGVFLIFQLIACGYGCLQHRDCYGNGALYAWGLNGRQRKRFEKAAKAEGGKADGQDDD